MLFALAAPAVTAGPGPAHSTRRPRQARRPRAAIAAIGAGSAVLTALLAGCSGDRSPAASEGSRSTGSAQVAPASPTSGPATPSEPVAAGSATREVLRRARAAALAAPSATVAGTIRGADGRTFTIALRGNTGGTDQRLGLTIPGAGVAEVLTVGGNHWLGGDLAFWTEQTGDAAAARTVLGKYVVISDSDATELGNFTLRGILTEAFARPEVSALEKVTTPAVPERVGGRDTMVIGSAAGPRFWVAADGSGDLVRYVGPRGAPADLTFSGWGVAPVVRPPPPALIVEQ